MLASVVKAVSRAHGYALFKSFLERSQWWSTDRRDAWIHRELRRTLVAAAAVPFYREQFAALGFDPRTDVRSVADLARLPILTRADVRAQGSRLYAPRLSYVPAHTSGTTGEPLALRLSESFLAFDAACVFRHWSWAGYSFRDPVVALRSYVPEQPGQELWRYSIAQNTLFFSAYHLTPQTCETYLERILAFRPRVIRGYPSTMAVFAEYAYRRRHELAFVTGVITSSETLLEHERETIERTFGNKVLDWYGMTEPAVVLTECERRQGMHVNWEYGHAELVPSDELAPGEYRLVTTGFHNPVMPLIRYDTGDIVRAHHTDRRCDCGRNMPLLHSVSGRKDECIYTPDGRRLPSVNFYTMFRAFDDVLRFQIAQYGQREVVVRVAPRANQTLGTESLARIRRALEARLGPAVALAVEVTDRFITNADGKSPPIVRRPATRAAEERSGYAVATHTAWTRHATGTRIHKLDLNEADCVPSPRVRAALLAALAQDETICWYPSPAPQQLLEKIAAYVECRPEHVLLTHGSDMAIELIASTFIHDGDVALLLAPTYDQFRATIERRGARVVTFEYDGTTPLDLDALEQALRANAVRIVYICNPNNPLGYALDLDVLRRIETLCRTVGCLLVVDEAYYELCGISIAGCVVQPDSPLVVLRTFSKAFGLAGLRIGYLLASGSVMCALRKAHNPKSVTTLATTAALAALDDLPSVQAYAEEVKHGREHVVALLRRSGARAYPSAGNYVLFEWRHAAELARHLDDAGIVVRDRTAQTGGRPSLRVTIGSRRSVAALVHALDHYFASSPAEK